ncbi:acyl-CoA dehydrogenase [Paracoccus limosus]|uniref:Acyl-CoA dehydrogenase n=1 Tax=Paracoccus limosus TaxID=913252 RepID=A0A844H7J0_9RHOB|nr:acyl-CoA dehydrogenase family protein [Paracoccus limosus]MTH35231.1 acyl-CoA dehydrogenase [Paracoccus limosus]
MSAGLDAGLRGWLAANACAIDQGAVPAAGILPQLTKAGVTRIGVPETMGGAGGDTADAMAAVAGVARESLAAAFVLWGHRCYVEFLVQSSNPALRERQLPDVLAARVAGASALSNAMKHLAGLEPLQVRTRDQGAALLVDGKLPWVTNLRPEGFWVAAAADPAEGGPARVIALSSDDAGLTRSADLELLGMRSSDTAAVDLAGIRIGRDRIIAEDAPAWLPGVRPVFIALQCGMALGLAERALDEAEASGGAGRTVLAADLAARRTDLAEAAAAIASGLRERRFVTAPAELFRLRIRLADLVAQALALELQAGGGRCYLAGPGREFARRWRESAFIPVITPSIVQLRAALAAAKMAA